MRQCRRIPSCRLTLMFLGGALLAGCQGKSQAPDKASPSFPGTTLKVGAVDAAELLSSVALIRGEWEASRGASIAIDEQPVPLESLSAVDVFLFPGQRLGDLVDAGVLATIPNAAVIPPRPRDPEPGQRAERTPVRTAEAAEDPFQYTDIAPAFREQASRYGPDRLALPCGGSALVLVYRNDAFETAANRAAARQAGLSLEKPPETWGELDALAKFFQGRDWTGDGTADHGIAVALGPDAEGVGDAAFLARAAGLAQHRDHFSFAFDSSDALTPRIDDPPFVEALAGMIALKASGPPGIEQFDATAARGAFRAGNVAMLIDRAERAATWSHGKRLSVAPLPGSDRVYDPVRKVWEKSSPPNAPRYLSAGGGWLIALNSTLAGTKRDAALDLVKYLAEPENVNRLRGERTFPMLPVRTSQMAQGLPDPMSAPDVDSRLWSDAVSRTLLADRIVPGLRIPGAGGYLGDLTKGRVAAVAGEPPAQALAAVSRAWAERTKTLGPKRQLWHYRRSLNTLATPPEPPPRGQ
jgi:multiple sugar transport system substrate-binding protein